MGLLKAKLAKFRQALIEGDAKSGSGKVRKRNYHTKKNDFHSSVILIG